MSLSDIIPEEKLRARPASNVDNNENAHSGKRIKHLSETSDCGSTDSSGCELFVEECDALQEMFPDSSYLEVHFILFINHQCQ